MVDLASRSPHEKGRSLAEMTRHFRKPIAAATLRSPIGTCSSERGCGAVPAGRPRLPAQQRLIAAPLTTLAHTCTCLGVPGPVKRAAAAGAASAAACVPIRARIFQSDWAGREGQTRRALVSPSPAYEALVGSFSLRGSLFLFFKADDGAVTLVGLGRCS